MSRSTDPVVIAHYHYRHEAEFAMQVLDDAAIPAAMQADDAGGIEMGMAFVRPVRIRVRPEDVDRARDALRGAGLLEDEEDR